METPELVFDHIGYVVDDMEKAIKRWNSNGYKVVIEPTHDLLQKVWCSVLVDRSGVRIELVSPDGDLGPLSSRLARGGGLDHLCFRTNDLDAALIHEESLGALIICPRTYAVTFNEDIAFVLRRTGLLVELMTSNHDH